MARKLSAKRRKVFSFSSTNAKSVKLAGDFTQWEKKAVSLKKQRDGQWTALVDLSSGTYQYRFLVDGEWCDDPTCNRRVANPYGGENAVCEVDSLTV